MSVRDDEAEREQGFLGRWIKRKAEVQDQSAAEAAAQEEVAPLSESAGSEAADPQLAEQGPAFDLSTLPKLDEITAQTNITDFMRREVPAALRNAALRQAWAIDPAIRDYVNPAREYAYDWNIPGGVPGNGPIEAGFDALKHVMEAFSKPPADHTFDLGKDTPVGREDEIASSVAAPEPASAVRMSNMKEQDYRFEIEDKNVISNSKLDEPPAASQEVTSPRRRHGGAAPV